MIFISLVVLWFDRNTLTWGVNQSTSKSPPNTAGWGGPSASPPKTAGGAWGSQPSSRPSSASTPAGGMNDAAWPDMKAASSGPSSRPASAAGKVEQQGPSESAYGPQTQSRLTSTPTSQLLSIEHRPHSAEARSGAVSDHNRSGDGGPFMPAWRGAADRKQVKQQTSTPAAWWRWLAAAAGSCQPAWFLADVLCSPDLSSF